MKFILILFESQENINAQGKTALRWSMQEYQLPLYNFNEIPIYQLLRTLGEPLCLYNAFIKPWVVG
jgi:hypothetical protein